MSIKTARSGFTEAQQILGLCTGLGVDVVMGNQIDTQIGTLATVAFGAAHEATSRRAGELSNFLECLMIFSRTPRIRDGKICLRDVPGVGAEIAERKTRHATDRIANREHRQPNNEGTANHALSGQDGRQHPSRLPPAKRKLPNGRERSPAQDLQRDGRWLHLWRVVGQYSNYSVFDVAATMNCTKYCRACPSTVHANPGHPLAQHPSALVSSAKVTNQFRSQPETQEQRKDTNVCRN